MKIGVAGLGQMGSGFAARLLAAGEHVIGWNRTKSKAAALIEQGMRWADSPRALAEASDVVLTMVANGPVLDAVLGGEQGLLSAIGGKVLVEMSTIAPSQAKALAVRVAEAGGALLDAPVLGNHLSIAQGKLLVMVGGDEAVLARVRAPLEKLALKVVHVGAVGQGKVMKLALNLGLATQILAFSEGLLLAVKSGIPRDTALQLLLGGASASPMIQYRGPLVKGQPDPAWFDCTMMQKDVQLALELAREVGVPLPTTTVADQWLTKAREAGLAHYDFRFSTSYWRRRRGRRSSFRNRGT
jgi:3-hydroxyisobutyrate dehydrogenase-like beta-hydroxyacid dehydrogenase